jgi:serine/threonine protein kinase
MAQMYAHAVLLVVALLGMPLQAADQKNPIGEESRYKSWPELGQGNYGVVRQFKDCAVKIVEIKDETSASRAILEAAIYKAFNGLFVDSNVDVVIHRGSYGYYIEIHLPQCKPIKADQFSLALTKTISFLQCIHGQHIANRDIKTQHIMMNGQSVALIDWGMTDIFTACPINAPGTTRSYSSPEILLKNFKNPKEGDVWALGIALLETALSINDVYNSNQGPPELSRPFGVVGKQRISDILKNSLQKVSDIPMREVLASMLKLELHERMSAENLLKTVSAANNGALPRKIQPLQKPIFHDKSQITPRMRKITYIWLYDLMVDFKQPFKVLFEAMSMADVFIKTTPLTTFNLQLAASIAFYLAEDFYDSGHQINFFVDRADRAFTKEEFKDFMPTLLENAQFNLIFEHPLRAFQMTIYHGNLSLEEQDMAVHFLTMLEIDCEAYEWSSQEKWQLTEAVVQHVSKGLALSSTHKDSWQSICKRFSQKLLAERPNFSKLCSAKL